MSNPNRRAMQPPGGDCHDLFEYGGDCSGSSPAPSNNPHHRITKPPGGETSDIFTTPTGTPPSTPRKVKNYMASTIFTPVTANGAEQKNARQRPDGNSFNRLFGIGAEDGTDGASPPATPRGGKNYQKSNVIFTGENGHARHTNGNGYARSMNGSEGSYSGSSSGSVTPNGSINGDADHPRQEVHNGGTPTRRIPPGGFSSKLW